MTKKNWKVYPCIKTLKKKQKPDIVDNPIYTSKDKRPKWCIKNNKSRVPCFKCLSGCRFLSYGEGDVEDYKALETAFNRRMDKK